MNIFMQVERDCTQRKKYPHVDLIHMIHGMDGDRGSAVLGGRGYFFLSVQQFSHSMHLFSCV